MKPFLAFWNGHRSLMETYVLCTLALIVMVVLGPVGVNVAPSSLQGLFVIGWLCAIAAAGAFCAIAVWRATGEYGGTHILR